MKVRNFVGLLSERLLLDASLRRGLYVLEHFQINHLSNYQKIGGYYIYCHVDSCKITILGPIPLRCVVVVVVFFPTTSPGLGKWSGNEKRINTTLTFESAWTSFWVPVIYWFSLKPC